MAPRYRVPYVGTLALVVFGQRGQVRVVHVMQAHAAEAGAASHDGLSGACVETFEGAVLLGRHAHVAEHEDAVARPRALDLGERRIVHRPCEIGADYLGAKLALNWTDRELHLPYDYAAWTSTLASPRSSRPEPRSS